MNAWLAYLLGLAASSSLVASFFLFDRLLQIEARACPDGWKREGRPVGLPTWARWRREPCNPLAHTAAFLRGCWFEFICLFYTPEWVRERQPARRLLWAARSLRWGSLIGIMIFKDAAL